jgi:hypothetical protein
VNQGGEQGHDDYGLPPVDIEVPDDARELYRDVQAYHRELRALRRHQRSLRWRAPFRRSGMAIPLLAGCLIVALVAVMVSAMLTANPYQVPGQPAAGRSRSSIVAAPRQPATSQSASASTSKPAATRLPARTISVRGKAIALRNLRDTALAIVLSNCACDSALGQLLSEAQHAGVAIYLVGEKGASAARLGQIASAVRGTKVATDDGDVLTYAYRPVGLTVLLVDSHGMVHVAEGLSRGVSLESQLRLLKPRS